MNNHIFDSFRCALFALCVILACPLRVGAQPRDRGDIVKVMYGDDVREITLHPERITTLYFTTPILRVRQSHQDLFITDHEYGTELAIMPKATARVGAIGHIAIRTQAGLFEFDLRVVRDPKQSMLRVACGDGIDIQPTLSRGPLDLPPPSFADERPGLFRPAVNKVALEIMKEELGEMFRVGELRPTRYAFLLILVLSGQTLPGDHDAKADDLSPLYCRQGTGLRRCGYIVESEEQFKRADL